MKYLGVDFGLRRIGLAASNGDIASPQSSIEVKGFKDAVKQVVEIANKGGYDKIIIGLPERKMGQVVTGFIKALKKNGLDVETADETLSSQKATTQMIESNMPKNKRRANDAVAASIILQDWLDNR